MAVEVEPPPAAADLLIDSRPDWARIDFDLECPRCGYNVRMLDTPRCPECGLEFSWHDLLHAHFTTNRFLFEHQWRNRPIRSWLVTAGKCFRPKRFWSEVSLYDRVHVGPLWFFVIPSMLLFFVLFHGLPWLGHVLLSALMQRGVLPPSWDLVNDTLRSLSLVDLRDDPSLLYFDWGFACLLLGALGSLLLLRETLGKCRVRNAQVFRVFAYSALPGAAVVVAAADLTIFALDRFESRNALPTIWMPIVALLAVATPFGLLLGGALKSYLGLPRPQFLGITAAFIGLLAAEAIPTLLVRVFW